MTVRVIIKQDEKNTSRIMDVNKQLQKADVSIQKSRPW